MNDPQTRRAIDPDRRVVVFTKWSRRHIMAARPELLDELGAILGTIARPDREPDPLPGRERFYRRRVTECGWS